MDTCVEGAGQIEIANLHGAFWFQIGSGGKQILGWPIRSQRRLGLRNAQSKTLDCAVDSGLFWSQLCLLLQLELLMEYKGKLAKIAGNKSTTVISFNI
ncbi:unnamed protein product [Linum tenue]|uniref:Uncharacterized protein n=1 Tax=Linum tenue TaxID=586396 RepID=A0AAV0MIL2_9ROSI|nr:unnamed protein product [Linum tenue]CAI0446607.1 unnamed protein product [Linum tenue]